MGDRATKCEEKKGAEMDKESVAHEIADHLRGLDSIAKAEIQPTGDDVKVTTQGGVEYLVMVTPWPDVETESAAAE